MVIRGKNHAISIGKRNVINYNVQFTTELIQEMFMFKEFAIINYNKKTKKQKPTIYNNNNNKINCKMKNFPN